MQHQKTTINLFITSLTLGAALAVTAAQAHDGGVSKLKICSTEAGTLIEWELDHAHDFDQSWLTITQGSEPLSAAEFSVKDRHPVSLRWRFDDAVSNAEMTLTAAGLETLPYGHRVLASSCDGTRRAVLSQWQQQWVPAAG